MVKSLLVKVKSISENAADDCRIVVVGNPCNTNCMIAASQSNRFDSNRFTAMTRLDQNRAVSMLAVKAGVGVTEVSRMAIFEIIAPQCFQIILILLFQENLQSMLLEMSLGLEMITSLQ